MRFPGFLSLLRKKRNIPSTQSHRSLNVETADPPTQYPPLSHSPLQNQRYSQPPYPDLIRNEEDEWLVNHSSHPPPHSQWQDRRHSNPPYPELIRDGEDYESLAANPPRHSEVPLPKQPQNPSARDVLRQRQDEANEIQEVLDKQEPIALSQPRKPWYDQTDEERREEYSQCIAEAPRIGPNYLGHRRDSLDEESILAAKGLKLHEGKPDQLCTVCCNCSSKLPKKDTVGFISIRDLDLSLHGLVGTGKRDFQTWQKNLLSSHDPNLNASASHEPSQSWGGLSIWSLLEE
ncbi:hypothetical protein F4677DRAFT_448182 [Hypoxylon crocopeplum]|nr:hypothetical protein F4677DRAFT_448182 [Hypoxylon crocopeplum]